MKTLTMIVIAAALLAGCVRSGAPELDRDGGREGRGWVPPTPDLCPCPVPVNPNPHPPSPIPPGPPVRVPA
jgi:hypothetical protein